MKKNKFVNKFEKELREEQENACIKTIDSVQNFLVWLKENGYIIKKREGKLIKSFWIKIPEKNKWQHISIIKIKKAWWDIHPKIVYYLDGKEIKDIVMDNI